MLITKYRLAVLRHDRGAADRALGVPGIHAVRPHPARRLARPGNGRPARHQSAARADLRCSASAAASAGIAGVLAAPLWTITPSMATNAIMPAFVVVAIGGLGSFAGAVIAGLMVGVVTALTIQF